VYEVATTAFLDNGAGSVRALRGERVQRLAADGRVSFDPIPGSGFEMQADLVLLAMGFTGPAQTPLLDDLQLRRHERGAVWTDGAWQTSAPGVFAAGDMQRGQSLIVWAIDDGRRAARAVDAYLARS